MHTAIINKIFRALLVFSASMLLFMSGSVAQVKDPELPVVGDVEDRALDNRTAYQAEVIFIGGSYAGDVSFNSDYIQSGVKKGEVYYWSAISSIKILTWVRYVKGKDYIFYPESYEVILKKGERIIIEGNISQLNKFVISRNKKRRTMYSFYYDEYADGKWTNSGQTDFYEPSTKPAKGCVTAINFP